MISLITWQHLNVYSYKLKNNVCVISIFHLYEAKKLNKKKLSGKKLLWQVVKKVNFRPWSAKKGLHRWREEIWVVVAEQRII